MPTTKKTNIGDLEPGTDEWFQAFAELPYADQAALMNSASDPTSNLTQPFGFADMGEESGLGLAGTGYTIPGVLGGQGAAQLDPAYQGLLQFGGGVNIPQLTSAGKLDPYDLSQEQARNNLMQDQATSIADIILASLAGPGALDPASFAPVTTAPTERIATPGLTQLNKYAQGTGYKAYIAQKMQQGATDDEALADMYNFLAQPESADVSKESKALRQELIDSLPSAFNQGNQISLPSMVDAGLAEGAGAGRASQDVRGQFDESNIAKWANDLYFKVADDQANIGVGWQDPKTGAYYTQAPTQEDSPATQKFKNLGLPTPFAAYNDPEYLQMAYDANAPNLGADIQGREQNIADTQLAAQQAAQQARGPIDRNIQTQQLYRQNMAPAGIQARPNELQNTLNRIPGAPPSAATAPTRMLAGMGGPQVPNNAGQNFMNNITSGGLTNLASQYRPEQMTNVAPIKGLPVKGGGFNFFQGQGTNAADAHAMLNAAVNGIPGLGRGRPTKTVTLDKGTAKQSQAQADQARRAYTDAQTRAFNATRGSTPDLAAAVRALASARVAADAGRTPFKDAVLQRLLGQRAVGVRGL